MKNASYRGFTLVELVVVLVIIGVLAVSLLPRFFDATGTSEYLYRDQIINVMRNIQLRAMQCTDSACRDDLSRCNAPVLFIGSSLIGTNPSSCSDNLIQVGSGENISFSFSHGADLSFNSLGQPVTAENLPSRLCTSGGCQLTINAANTLRICIEREGYIHPC